MPTAAEARHRFATEITADAPELAGAFARVPREAFLSPGPWQYKEWNRRENRVDTNTTPDASPARTRSNTASLLAPAATSRSSRATRAVGSACLSVASMRSVPEPSSVALLGAGLACLIMRRRTIATS